MQLDRHASGSDIARNAVFNSNFRQLTRLRYPHAIDEVPAWAAGQRIYDWGAKRNQHRRLSLGQPAGL
jgi:hypothetical protein